MRTPTHTVNFMQPLLLPPARMHHKKRQKTHRRFVDLFDHLPDDLVVSVFCKLSSSATSPSHLINVFLTCKRFKSLALNPLVLAKASPRTLVGNPQRWSESTHRFLRLCVNAGNVEACYVLGMIRFYCLRNRVGGASLMAKAAIKSHAPALYALAVIQFNGSGASKNDKDLKAGVALCARAAFLGHIDALRELGHCLQDGYGVRQNIAEGRRLLLQANARELAFSIRALVERPPRSEDLEAAKEACSIPDSGQDTGCKLLTEFGLKVQGQETHPVNRFLKEWFESGMGVLSPELRLCSHGGCGRPETRSHEFRRCSVCGKVNYCSRGCQALDWRLRHKAECMAVERWLEDVAGVGIMGG